MNSFHIMIYYPIEELEGNPVYMGTIVGEISRVLFHIVFMEIFDRWFPNRIAFSRFNNEIFIAIRDNEHYSTYHYQIDMTYCGLVGEIESIEQGHPYDVIEN